MNRLRILREVAARGSIAAAARALYLTGPGVSHQLATLEREVGLPLLERTHRSVRLTEAGQYLARRAGLILAECDETLAGMESFSDEIRGTVRLSMNDLDGNVLMQSLRGEGAGHPALKILPVALPTSIAVPALCTGEFDIVLASDWDCLPMIPSPDIARQDLMSDTYFVVLAPSHALAGSGDPLCLRDLADEPWCLSSEELCREAVLLAMRSAGFEPRIACECQYSRSIAISAETGIGIGIVPRLADLRGLDVVLRPLAEPRLTRRLFAMVRAGRTESPAIRFILDAMRKGAALAQT